MAPPKPPVSDTTRLWPILPGSQTGIYYIPISNIPMLTPWTHLKDFVRTACEVDHAEIFPGSTSGWVRVIGHENFKAAYERLNGGILGGRSLVADKSNEYKPINIRALKIAPPEPRYGNYNSASSSSMPSMAAGQSAASMYCQTSPHGSAGLTGVPMPMPMPVYHTYTTAAAATADAGQYQPDPGPGPGPVAYTQMSRVPMGWAQSAQASMSPASYAVSVSPWAQSQSFYQGSAPFFYGQGGGYPPDNIDWGSATQDSIDAGQAPYDAGQPQQGQDPQVDSAQAGLSTPGPETGTVPTELRGIVIRNLSWQSTQRQIRSLIKEKCGQSAHDGIVNFNLPPGRGDPNRGYALLLFDHEDTAGHVVKTLDRLSFGGRKLEVFYAKPVAVNSLAPILDPGPSEGVSAASPALNSGQDRDSEGDRDGPRETVPKPETTRHGGSKKGKERSTDDNSNRRANEVLIVNGSSSVIPPRAKSSKKHHHHRGSH